MHTETEIDKIVIRYLNNCKIQYGELYSSLGLWGVRPDSIIKYLGSPESFYHKKQQYIDDLEDAIDKIYNKSIIETPEIGEQQLEDVILAKVLRNVSWVFDRSDFLPRPITKNHIIQYLERSKIIYQWNNDFLWMVKRYAQKTKDYLLK